MTANEEEVPMMDLGDLMTMSDSDTGAGRTNDDDEEEFRLGPLGDFYGDEYGDARDDEAEREKRALRKMTEGRSDSIANTTKSAPAGGCTSSKAKVHTTRCATSSSVVSAQKTITTNEVSTRQGSKRKRAPLRMNIKWGPTTHSVAVLNNKGVRVMMLEHLSAKIVFKVVIFKLVIANV
jgi:hypothetical protein